MPNGILSWKLHYLQDKDRRFLGINETVSAIQFISTLPSHNNVMYLICFTVLTHFCFHSPLACRSWFRSHRRIDCGRNENIFSLKTIPVETCLCFPLTIHPFHITLYNFNLAQSYCCCQRVTMSLIWEIYAVLNL